MTITLHWWALPLAIFIIASVWAPISARNESGLASGMWQALVWIVAVIASLALVLGHYL